jgi:hypothetical protein
MDRVSPSYLPQHSLSGAIVIFCYHEMKLSDKTIFVFVIRQDFEVPGGIKTGQNPERFKVAIYSISKCFQPVSSHCFFRETIEQVPSIQDLRQFSGDDTQ